MADYYDDLPGLNWSLLKLIEHSPARFDYARRNQRPDSDVFRRGRLLHALVLEPATVHDRFAVWPRRRQGKEWERFEGLNAGKTIVTEKQYDDANSAAAAVREVWRPEPGALLERPLVWQDDGVAMKARLDCLDSAVTELKTTRSTAHDAFTRQSWGLGYHCQLAHYTAGARLALGIVVPARIVAVELEPPYDVAVFEVEPELLAEGAEHVARLVQRVRECEKAGRWPRRYEMPMPLGKPSWVERAEEDDIGDLDLEAAPKEEDSDEF